MKKLNNTELKFNSEGIKVLEVLESLDKSGTQSIKAIIIQKDSKKFLSLQKWWRKTTEEDWNEGKGFHLENEDLVLLKDSFLEAIDKTK